MRRQGPWQWLILATLALPACSPDKQDADRAKAEGASSRQIESSQMRSSQVASSEVKEVERILSQYNATQTPSGIVMNVPADVLFDFDKHDIRPDAAGALAEIAKVLQYYRAAPVQINGHTDSVGADDYNQQLSERRAQAVKEHLTRNLGIDGGRVSTEGFGESKPVAPNTMPDGADDPEGRQKNRRVEIVIRK